MHSYRFFGCILAVTEQAFAQACSSATVSSSVPAPSVAPGYGAQLVATGLTKPRGITFDQQGHLLVVEQNSGVTALTLDDAGGACVSEKSRQTVVNDTSLNHGITLSFDGQTLYASSPEAVYSYPYNEQNASTTLMGNGTAIVANMTTSDHTTRTLLLSRKQNGTLIVTRGSTANIDDLAFDESTGHSQVKAFNLTNLTSTPYDFNTDGRLLGWGLRNDVGIDEEPNQGGIYSVENSADDLNRSGTDIHQNNPAEEMNFLGWLEPPNGTLQSVNQGSNFGYPQCFTAWDPSSLPNFDGPVGTQFAINDLNSTNNDTQCATQFTGPRLAFQAHMAPLDVIFNSEGTEAWVTFHGSWDRTDPSGYKVSAVAFNNGEPVDNSSSTTALTDIVANQDNSKCPDSCFRPVGLAWDSQGRLFFSSDATGEIYVITKLSTGNSTSTNSSGVDSSMPSAASSGPAGASSTSSTSVASDQHILARGTTLLLTFAVGIFVCHAL